MRQLTQADHLGAESLRQLVAGKVDLIWHRAFYAVAECEKAMPAIIRECEAARYTLTSDFQSLGTSIGEAAESAAHADRYFATAPSTTELIRRGIFAGQLSPIDLLRLSFDDLWPHGATVGRNEGRNMLPGIIRRWPSGAHANPHIDQREIPLLSHYALNCRIGANIYLEVPEPGSGGEIDFWGLYEREDDYVQDKRPDYGLDRESLGEPFWSCLPAQGDLLMFNAARVHGVRRVTQGARVTAACFIGARSDDEPLTVFA